MTIPLNLQCSLSSPLVPANAGERLIYLLIEVTGGEGAQTLPGNLGFIIDVSDSMRIRMISNKQFRELLRKGQVKEIITDGVPAYHLPPEINSRLDTLPSRIDYVSEALMIASEYLRPADVYSLVAFAGQAYAMIPSAPGSERVRLQTASRELQNLYLGDGTQMDAGIALAFEHVHKRIQERGSQDAFASRLILLTDGHTQNVSQCYDWAQKARQAGIKLSTMGIGSEFNEELLIPLADQTGGSAYYIEMPDKLGEAFRQELGAALRISYRNVEVKLQLPEGVALRNVYRIWPELGPFDPGPNMDGSYALLLGDYDPAAPQALLAEIVFPSRLAGSYRLAQALLVWDDPAGGLARPNQRLDVMLQVSDQQAGEFDPKVMDIVEKVGAYKMGLSALENAQNLPQSASQEEKSVATLRLREAATRLLDLGEAALGKAMLGQAEVLDRMGSIDADAAKKLRYETRRITKNL